MIVNVKPSLFFLNYNLFENTQLRFSLSEPVRPNFKLDVFSTIKSPAVKLFRSFSSSTYFDFVRFFNLLYFIFSSMKPKVGKKGSNFFIDSKVNYGNFATIFSVFYQLNSGPKSNFLAITYLATSGLVQVPEPHVVFSVNSPYFDYHSSKLNLSFNFNYSYKNPTILNIFNYFFLCAVENTFFLIPLTKLVKAPFRILFLELLPEISISIFFIDIFLTIHIQLWAIFFCIRLGLSLFVLPQVGRVG